MKKLLFISTILSTLLLFSCSDNAFQDMLFRTTDDPFQDVPVADSLTTENTVYLSWEEDEGCDEFFLMKAYDSYYEDLDFECVYEGTGTSFVDARLPEGDRYVYRLDKKRGTAYFTGNSYAYGFSSNCRRDSFEPNDVEDMATRLDDDLICNLNCVSYNTDNQEAMDYDWFYIELPPKRAADIVIEQQGVGEKEDTNLMFQCAEKEPEKVKSGDALRIDNPYFEVRKFYFRVYPDTTALFSDETRITSIGYTVSLSVIIKYL